MLSRRTSPLRDQQTESEASISTQTVSHWGIPRKSPGTSLVVKESHPSGDRWDTLTAGHYIPDNVSRHAADMTLLRTAAHDLRNPVSAILIYSELLTEALGHTADKEQEALLDSIRSVSQFMLRLLEDTLEFACSQPGTMRTAPAPSTLADIVEQSVAMNRPLAARKQMRLDLVQEGEPLLVLLNGARIRTVFNNLIENAIKYCQPGAGIEVRISRISDKVVVSVRDDGPGISPSDLDTLFIPFQRSHARAHCEEPGTGLGLAIAKQIVDLHGGRIGVESKVGKGTTFYVSLPAQASQALKRS